MNLDEAFEEKDKISSAVQETLTKSMHEYGFQIIKALVTELKPSQDVMNSMNEINKQKRLRDAAMMASEAEKIRVVKKAEADCEALKEIGANSKSNSVFIPHSPADGVRDISSQIRNGIMQGGAPGQQRM